MKTLLATLALVAAGTAASANTLYECERQTLPILGFTNKAAAESWYPENIWFVIDAQEEVVAVVEIDHEWQKCGQYGLVYWEPEEVPGFYDCRKPT